MTDIISIEESTRLIALEKVVTNGLQSWIEVGEALIEIRDSRLYRIEAKTFEEYCQSRFKMGKAHAHRLMTAAPIAKDLSPIGHIKESVIREIAKVAPERRAEVFAAATEAAAGHVPTAREIKQVVEMDDEEKAPVPAIQPDRLPRVIIDCADDLWLSAKSFLDTITKDDVSREKVLKEVIAYAQNRIEKRK
jgi:hypothetical protein